MALCIIAFYLGKSFYRYRRPEGNTLLYEDLYGKKYYLVPQILHYCMKIVSLRFHARYFREVILSIILPYVVSKEIFLV
jgi:hypothetical protein